VYLHSPIGLLDMVLSSIQESFTFLRYLRHAPPTLPALLFVTHNVIFQHLVVLRSFCAV
jgi:hypothetical protein